MKKSIIILLFVFFAQLNNLSGQIPIKHNLYYENGYTINPAAVFQNKLFSASLSVNQSYVGFEDAPQTNSIYFFGPISDKVGVGLNIKNSNQGIFTMNNFTGTYAYKVKFSENQFLSMGLSMGLSWQKTGTNQIDAINRDDPFLIDASYADKKYFVNEIGFMYRYNGLQLGLAAPYFVQSTYHHYYGYASIDIGTPRDEKGFTVTPMVFYQYLPINSSQVDASLKFRYKSLWTSAAFRSNGNMFLGIGAEFSNFRIAYSYEFNNQSLSHISNSSQEIMIAYKFNLRFKKNEKNQKHEKSTSNDAQAALIVK